MSFRDLMGLMQEASELGAKRALIEVGEIKPFISKSKAYSLYGRGVVQRWVEEGLIRPSKDGKQASWRYSRAELELLARTSNVATYIKTINK